MLPIEIESRMQALRAEAEKAGIELIDVQYRRAGSRGVLTFLVDKEGGVTLDECAGLNRSLGDYLDREAEASGSEGFLQGAYFLEVNSPGLDRPLKSRKDFERARDERVRVAYRAESGAGLVALGTLGAVDGQGIEILDKQGNRTRIPYGAITKASRDVNV